MDIEPETKFDNPYFEPITNPWALIVLFLSGFIFLALASFCLSLIIVLLLENDYSIATYYFDSRLDYFIGTFPYYHLLIFFLLLIISSIFFKFFNVRKNIFFLFISLLVISLAFSLLIFQNNLAKNSEKYLENIYFYNFFIKNRTELWQKAEFGLLSGTVSIVKNNDSFTMIDYDSKVWIVYFNNTEIEKNLKIKNGEKIKIVGKLLDEKSFEAKKIKKYE